MILHASEEGSMRSLTTVGRLLFRVLSFITHKSKYLQCLHHGILKVPEKRRMMQHPIAREALRIASKLLLSKHVIVLSQRKRRDVDTIEDFTVEGTAPVHQRLGENKRGKITLQWNSRKGAENLI